jgi:hypothetical protein
VKQEIAMKRLLIAAAIASFALSGVATAHPFSLRFDTRGACEKEQALVNHYDRDHVAGPVFGIDQNGEAQVFFLESFQCEYDSAAGKWRIADHRGDDSDTGNAFDD